MPTDRVVRFETFRGTFASWDDLFAQAAEFATRLGPGPLISISHSEDENDGVVTVWYWDDAPPPTVERAPAVEQSRTARY